MVKIPQMDGKEYKVPRLLWESLESVLLAQGKRYVREMAKTLKVNEKELLKRVFPTKDAVRITLHDTTTVSLQCTAYLPGQIVHLCRKPVLLGSTFCESHQQARPLVSTPANLEKLADDGTRPPLWTQSDGTVLDATGTSCGMYHKDTSKLVLFQIT
jgi:hypothetical protein